MIKYNNSNINDWNYDAANIIKVYRNNAIVYYKLTTSGGTPEFKVCYAVVDDISQYQETEFVDVFNKADGKWYKLNNLFQYEEYGIYGSGRTITYYDGKLTIDGDYEYLYSGSSWVNVGEVSGSTATLPNVEFMLNYNAKNYNSSTHSITKTDGQLKDVDAVCSYGYDILDHSSDGYISITGDSRMLISGTTYMGRNNTQTGCTMTIVSKVKTSSGYSILTNRGGTSSSEMNWMWRYPSNGIFLHGSSRYNNPLYFTTTTNTPIIASIKTYYDNGVKQQLNDWTNNGSYSGNFEYGTEYNGNSSLFCDYSKHNGEFWQGDFYWVYMSKNVLTDEQIQQVINYNESSGTEYPIYYSEKSDPLDNLTFNTLEEAETYACANCVYDGMRATIDGDKYTFDSENGWVKSTQYYYVEDVTPNGASGWTISGSATYNPDSSYYDDYDLQTTSTSNSYKIAKVTFYGYENFTYYLRSYSPYSASYGYVMASNVDELSTDPTSMNYNDISAITNTYNFSKAAKSNVGLSNYRRVTYNNLDKTVEHTFYVVFYGRTYSSYVSNATILIPKEQTNENWEQVTFSASSNVASTQKNLYIDGNYSNNGGTQYFYYRWMVGLPSGSHSSYTNYSSYDYCPDVTSSTFTSVAGEQRQVEFTYDSTTNKTLQFRLVDTSGNTLTPTDAVYYALTGYNSCNASYSFGTYSYPRSFSNLKVGGRFRFGSSSNREYIYGYTPNVSLNTDYYVDNYTTNFDITYTKLDTEAVTITYTTYDPNDSETPAFKTDITYPYSGGTTSSTTLTSYDVPYTYSYTVKQTSNLFSASTASYTYTAGQASRTITFTSLYPNNRVFSTVADLEAYVYVWEGMTAYVGSDKYVYENSEWVYKPSRVPQGYTEVEYIENTTSGTNYYIDTQFKPNQDTRVILEAQASVLNNNPRMFGSGPWNGLAFVGNIENVPPQKFYFKYGQTSTWWQTNVTADTNKHTFDLNKNSYYIDNVLANTASTSTFQLTTNLGIFNAPSTSLFTDGETFIGKVFSCKVYDNGTLIRDLVPCYRDSDSKSGLYDTVNDVFYTAVNTSYNFTVGPVV